MWDFSQYISREQSFKDLSWGSLEVAGARTGAGARVRASKTILRIRCKSFLVYLGTSIIAIVSGIPAGYLENSDSGDREESRRATKRHSRRGQPRSHTEVILALIFF